MTLKNWIIDLRVDFDSKEKEEIILKAVKSAAKQLYVTAQLIADKRKPDIIIQSDDIFAGREEVSIYEDGELEEPI